MKPWFVGTGCLSSVSWGISQGHTDVMFRYFFVFQSHLGNVIDEHPVLNSLCFWAIPP